MGHQGTAGNLEILIGKEVKMNKLLKFSLPILLILGLVLITAYAQAPSLAPSKESPMPRPAPAPTWREDSSAKEMEPTTPTSGAAGQHGDTERMIVRTGNMSLVVEDIHISMDDIAEDLESARELLQ